MKRVLTLLFTLFLSSSLQANATSIPGESHDGGDYFKTTCIWFADIWEQASYESDFGLYSMVDPTDKFEIFSYNQEPLAFDYVSSADWAPLAEGFGFYFDVHTGGTDDATAEYNWFSDSSLNQKSDGTAIDVGVEHVSTYLFGEHLVFIALDDQLGGGDRDFNDMIVGGKSCCGITPTAPVPEPATMLLLGTGLVGIAGSRFRKKKK